MYVIILYVIGVMLHYLALGRFFFVKSAREILNGIAHVAITLTTLKAEKVTYGDKEPNGYKYAG